MAVTNLVLKSIFGHPSDNMNLSSENRKSRTLSSFFAISSSP